MADQVADVREVMLVSGQKNSFSFKKKDGEQGRPIDRLYTCFTILSP